MTYPDNPVPAENPPLPPPPQPPDNPVPDPEPLPVEPDKEG